jgi:hypothetical protein
MAREAFQRIVERAGKTAEQGFAVHPHMLRDASVPVAALMSPAHVGRLKIALSGRTATNDGGAAKGEPRQLNHRKKI